MIRAASALAVLSIACASGCGSEKGAPVTGTSTAPAAGKASESPAPEAPKDPKDPKAKSSATGDGVKADAVVCVVGTYPEIKDTTTDPVVVTISYPRYSNEDYQPGTFGVNLNVRADASAADTFQKWSKHEDAARPLFKKVGDDLWALAADADCPPGYEK